jgi:putative addiction module killer protein
MRRADQRHEPAEWACTPAGLGDTRTGGGGVREMRVHVGPGYRVYFAQRHGAVLLLLCGGAKSSQARDIGRAKLMLAAVDKE